MYTSQYEVGVCLTFMQNGQTALMYASLYGETDTVRVLLDCGAIVDLRDNVRIIDMIEFVMLNNHLHIDMVLLCRMGELLFGGQVARVRVRL